MHTLNWHLVFKKEWILLFLAAYLPFEPFLLKWVPDAVYIFARYLPEFVIYALIAWIGIESIRKQKLAHPPIAVPFILLIITAVISMILNQTPLIEGIFGIRHILRFILVAFIAYYLAVNERFVRNLCVILFTVLFFQSAVGLAQGIIGAPLDQLLIPSERQVFGDIQLTGGVSQFWESGQRVFGTMGRYDQLGVYMTLALLLVAGFFYEWRTRGELRQLLFLAVSAVPTFLLTYSRAAWFGLVLGLVGIGFGIKRDRRVLAGAGLLAALAGGYLAFSLTTNTFLIDVPNQSLSHRFFEAFSLERWKGEYDAFGRLYYFVKTPTVVVAHAPFFGVGPGSYGAGTAAAFHTTTQYDKLGLPFGIHGTEGYIDNNWFSIWGELGTIGLALYVWIVVIFFRVSWRVYRRTDSDLYRAVSLGFIGIMIAVCFQAFLATYLEMRTLAYYFWLLGGVLLAEYTRFDHRSI